MYKFVNTGEYTPRLIQIKVMTNYCERRKYNTNCYNYWYYRTASRYQNRNKSAASHGHVTNRWLTGCTTEDKANKSRGVPLLPKVTQNV